MSTSSAIEPQNTDTSNMTDDAIEEIEQWQQEWQDTYKSLLDDMRPF